MVTAWRRGWVTLLMAAFAALFAAAPAPASIPRPAPKVAALPLLSASIPTQENRETSPQKIASGVFEDTRPEHARWFALYLVETQQARWLLAVELTPEVREWLSRDPLGEQGGLNLTAFCGNDPVNQVDPLGLEPNNEWYSVSTFIPQPQPPPLPPLAPQPKCWIQNARSPRQQADVPVMRDYAREKVKYFQQCNALVPSALRGTPVADQLMEIQSEAVLSAFAQPAIAFGCAKFGQFFRIGRLMTGAERVSLTEARAIEALGTPLRTAPITWASPLETGVNLYHATPATAARVQGLLSGIDPKFLQNPYNRFGPAFYVSERGGGAFAEVVANGHSPLYEIRYSLNTARMAVLDLTDPEMALAWGYSGGPVSSATQAIGTRARRCGFNVIRFKSIRGSGFNLAVLSEFNDILVPEMIFPIP